MRQDAIACDWEFMIVSPESEAGLQGYDLVCSRGLDEEFQGISFSNREQPVTESPSMLRKAAAELAVAVRWLPGSQTMSIRSTIGLAAALTFGTATACLAERPGLPTIDFHKICREIHAVAGESHGTVSGCIASEREAREQILKEWHSFPASARSVCIKPNAFMPTYVRWLTCLELHRDRGNRT